VSISRQDLLFWNRKGRLSFIFCSFRS